MDVDREGIAVTDHDGDQRRASCEEHREDVVRRLLAAGLSPRLLHGLMPEFSALIDELSER